MIPLPISLSRHRSTINQRTAAAANYSIMFSTAANSTNTAAAARKGWKSNLAASVKALSKPSKVRANQENEPARCLTPSIYLYTTLP